MKKFSSINENNQEVKKEPKGIKDIISTLVDEKLSINIEGENAEELTGKVKITIEGKEELTELIENLINIKMLKVNKNVLESVRAKSFHHLDLRWIGEEINNLDKILNEEK